MWENDVTKCSMNKITGYPKESPTATPTTALCVEMEFTLTFQASKILAHSRLYVVFINYQNGFYYYHYLAVA